MKHSRVREECTQKMLMCHKASFLTTWCNLSSISLQCLFPSYTHIRSPEMVWTWRKWRSSYPAMFPNTARCPQWVSGKLELGIFCFPRLWNLQGPNIWELPHSPFICMQEAELPPSRPENQSNSGPSSWHPLFYLRTSEAPARSQCPGTEQYEKASFRS